MSYITDKIQFLRDNGDCIPLEVIRSEGRMKNYSSATDARAWGYNGEDRRQHILELISRSCKGLRLGRYVPIEVLIYLLVNSKNKIANDIKLSNKYDLTDLKNALGEVETLRKRLQVQDTNIREKEEELERMKRNMRELQEEIEKKNVLLGVCEEKLNNVQDNLDATIDDVGKQKHCLCEEMAQLHEDLFRCKCVIDAKQREIEYLYNEFEEKRSFSDDLAAERDECIGLLEQCKNLEAEINSQKLENGQLKETIEFLQKNKQEEVGELESKLDSCTRKNEMLQEKLRSLEQPDMSAEEYKNYIKINRTAYDSDENVEVKSKADNDITKRKEINAEKDECIGLLEQCKNLEAETNSQNLENEQFEETIESLQKKKQEEVGELESKLDSCTRKNVMLQEKLRSLEQPDMFDSDENVQVKSKANNDITVVDTKKESEEAKHYIPDILDGEDGQSLQENYKAEYSETLNMCKVLESELSRYKRENNALQERLQFESELKKAPKQSEKCLQINMPRHEEDGSRNDLENDIAEALLLIKKLKEDIAELETKTVQLEDALDDSSTLQELCSKIDEGSKLKVGSCVCILGKSCERICLLEDENNYLKNVVHEIQDNCTENLEADVENLSMCLERLGVDLRKEENARRLAEEKLETFSRVSESVRSNADELKDVNNVLEDEIRRLKSSIVDAEEELKGSLERSNEMENKFKLSLTQLSIMEMDLDLARNRLMDVTRENEELKREMNDLINEHLEVKNVISKCDSDVANLKKENLELLERINALKDTNKVPKECKFIKKKLDEFEKIVDELDVQVNNDSDNVEFKYTKIATTKESKYAQTDHFDYDINVINIEYDSLKMENENLKNTVKTMQNENQELRNTIRTLHEEVQNIQEIDNKKSEDIVRNLKIEYGQLQDTLREMEKKNIELQNGIDARTKSKEKLETENCNLNNQLTQILLTHVHGDRLKEVEKDNEGLKQTFNECNEELQAEINKLEEQLQELQNFEDKQVPSSTVMLYVRDGVEVATQTEPDKNQHVQEAAVTELIKNPLVEDNLSQISAKLQAQPHLTLSRSSLTASIRHAEHKEDDSQDTEVAENISESRSLDGKNSDLIAYFTDALEKTETAQRDQLELNSELQKILKEMDDPNFEYNQNELVQQIMEQSKKTKRSVRFVVGSLISSIDKEESSKHDKPTKELANETLSLAVEYIDIADDSVRNLQETLQKITDKEDLTGIAKSYVKLAINEALSHGEVAGAAMKLASEALKEGIAEAKLMGENGENYNRTFIRDKMESKTEAQQSFQKIKSSKTYVGKVKFGKDDIPSGHTVKGIRKHDEEKVENAINSELVVSGENGEKWTREFDKVSSDADKRLEDVLKECQELKDALKEVCNKCKELEIALENERKECNQKLQAVKLQADKDIKATVAKYNEGIQVLQRSHEENLTDVSNDLAEEKRTIECKLREKEECCKALESERNELKRMVRSNSIPVEGATNMAQRRHLSKRTIENVAIPSKTCDAPVYNPNQALSIYKPDYNDSRVTEILHKVLNGGFQALVFEELSLLHSLICNATAKLIARPGNKNCNEGWKEVDKTSLMKKISVMERELAKKQTIAQKKVGALKNAILTEKQKMEDIKSALHLEKQRNDDLANAIDLQTESCAKLAMERDFLKKHNCFCESKIQQLVSAIEVERNRIKKLEDEVKKGKRSNYSSPSRGAKSNLTSNAHKRVDNKAMNDFQALYIPMNNIERNTCRSSSPQSKCYGECSRKSLDTCCKRKEIPSCFYTELTVDNACNRRCNTYASHCKPCFTNDLKSCQPSSYLQDGCSPRRN